MPKKGKLPPSANEFVYRSGRAKAAEGEGPIPLILATESPVRVWDYGERAIMDETLLMEGLVHGEQVPLLDSHDRSQARKVIGSIRDLRVAGSQLEGNAYFATNPHAQSIRDLYVDGHMTDFSVGFEPGAIEKVREGEKKTIGGRTYEGPARVVTSAKVKEGSAVAIGADENAKALLNVPALRAYTQPDQLQEEHEMDAFRDFCLRAGMPADTSDFQQWAEDNLGFKKREEPQPQPEVLLPDVPPPPPPIDERERAAKITHLCAIKGISQQQAASYIASTLTVGEVAEDILKKTARERSGPQTGPIITPLESETDKFIDGAKGALVSRCLIGVNVDKAEQQAKGKFQHNGREIYTGNRDHRAIEAVEEVKKLVESPLTREFRNVGLCGMARMFAEAGGVRTWGMSNQDIVRDALRRDLFTRGESAYHVTGTFTNLLLDAANKTLLMAYEEANVTYPLWVRQAPSTSDYKTINRIRLGELPDPDIVPENMAYGEAAVSDNKESYTPDKYGHIFSISLEAIVNDDLNAISRIPAQQGAAMRRKINKVCYSQLTANAALSDGIALFHATSHGANLDAVALSIAALNTGFTVMMTQTGLNTAVTLNVTPRYLIVPAALAATAFQLTGSMADPSNTAGSTEDATRPNYNSGTLNLYGPSGPRPLMVIVDAILDGTSATGWYLAAEPNQIDTVELTFLQGEETPYLSREEGFTVDAVRYKIRQTFGAKPIDYRGLYQGNS